MSLTRKIQEELANVSDLVDLHESNLKLLQDYELRLVNYYHEIISNPGKNETPIPMQPFRSRVTMPQDSIAA
jgi:hypothetical protein